MIDVLFDGRNFVELVGARVSTARPSTARDARSDAALTAALAQGRSVVDSARTAKSYVSDAIRRGISVGAGSRVLLHS